MKVVVGGVGERLPPLLRADQFDPSLPDFLPGCAVLVAHPLKAALRCHPNQPRRLPMGFVVRLAGDKARVLAEDITALGPRLDGVRGRERCELIVLFAAAFHPVAPIETRDVGSATGR